MIISQLQSVIKNISSSNDPLYTRTLLKEELQNYVLRFVYNNEQYKTLVFTGGSCLRKIYGLPRLSEDLDFDFTETFEVEKFARDLTKYFASELQYKDMDTKIANNESILYVKFPILTQLNLKTNNAESDQLFLRCDFSKQQTDIFGTEINSISTTQYTFFVKSYDLETLFANKLFAFLNRNFYKGSNQQLPFKGRDIFDINWFLEQSVRSNFAFQPNWGRLFKLTNINSKKDIIDQLTAKITTIDSDHLKQDLIPFIQSSKEVQNLADNLPEAILSKLQKFPNN